MEPKPDDGKKADEPKPDDGKEADEAKPDDGKKAVEPKPDDGKKADEPKADDGKKADPKKPDDGKKPDDTKKPNNATSHDPKGDPKKGDTKKRDAKKRDAKKRDAKKRDAAKKGGGGKNTTTADAGSEAREEVLRQVRPSRHITIRARSVKLKASSHERLLNIARRYHEATGRKLVITGGDRTPLRQAQLMVRKLAQGDDLLKLYTQVRLVLEIQKTYEQGKRDKKGERQIIRAVADVIAKQVKRGQYVSHHLAYTAADVRSRGLKDSDVAALRAAVKAEPGATLVDERNTEAPHFHLGL